MPATAHSPDPLSIQSPLVPVIYPQVRDLRIPERFPELDAWVVPIHKVANRRGQFRSSDLKDFVGLPSDRKLILSTCAPDDYQEMLWREGAHMDFRSHNLDYWFPGHFSIYDGDSRLQQFVNARRQQVHAVVTKSQFVWFRLGECIPLEFLAPIRGAASVLLSTGQMYSRKNRRLLTQEVQLADGWFPRQTEFFVLGQSARLPIRSGRKCHDVNSTWLLRGVRGYGLNRERLPDLSRAEVLLHNLKELQDVHRTDYGS